MQINRRTLLAAGGALVSGLSLPAWAQLRIEITGVGANQMPIAIPQFQGTNNAPLDLSAVITADLERSGAFRALKVMGDFPAGDCRQGMLWNVYDDCIVVQRREFLGDVFLGPDWVMPLAASEPRPFDFAARAKVVENPDIPVPEARPIPLM